MTPFANTHSNAASSQDALTPWLIPHPNEAVCTAIAQNPGPALPPETLAQRLDWVLAALPVAQGIPDVGLEQALLQIDPAGRLVLRSIRLSTGCRVDLVAVPCAVADDPEGLAALRRLQRRRRRSGLTLRLIGEGVVAREPRLTQARLIADCAAFRPTLRAGRRLIHALRAQGGSALLKDCLASLRGEADPACAVLALVGIKLLTVPLDEPLGPDTRVSLSPLTCALA